MTALLLGVNVALGLLATFVAAGYSVNTDPWPACYLFFPLMEFAGVPGFLVAFVMVAWTTRLAPCWAKKGADASRGNFRFVCELWSNPFQALADHIRVFVLEASLIWAREKNRGG